MLRVARSSLLSDTIMISFESIVRKRRPGGERECEVKDIGAVALRRLWGEGSGDREVCLRARDEKFSNGPFKVVKRVTHSANVNSSVKVGTGRAVDRN